MNPEFTFFIQQEGEAAFGRWMDRNFEAERNSIIREAVRVAYGSSQYSLKSGTERRPAVFATASPVLHAHAPEYFKGKRDLESSAIIY